MTSSCVTFSWMGNGGAHCSIESSCFHARAKGLISACSASPFSIFSEHAGVYALDPNPWFEAGLWCHNAHWCLSSSVHIWSRAVRSTIPNWFCGILCWWYAQWNWQLQWTECLLEAYPECGSSPPAISFQVPNNPNGKSFPNHVDIQIEFALKSHQVHLDWNPKADSQHLIATLFCCDVVSGNHNYHNWQINKHKHQLD